MSELEKTFQDVSKDLANDFSTLKSDVASLASIVGDLAKAHTSAAKTNVYGVVDQAKELYAGHADRLTDKAADVSQKVRDASEDLGGAVQHNPLTALSLAFLSGLVIGMMSKSSS